MRCTIYQRKLKIYLLFFFIFHQSRQLPRFLPAEEGAIKLNFHGNNENNTMRWLIRFVPLGGRNGRLYSCLWMGCHNAGKWRFLDTNCVARVWSNHVMCLGGRIALGVDWVTPDWLSVTTVESYICVTYLKSINFISDYHTLCVDNSV